MSYLLSDAIAAVDDRDVAPVAASLHAWSHADAERRRFRHRVRLGEAVENEQWTDTCVEHVANDGCPVLADVEVVCLEQMDRAAATELWRRAGVGRRVGPVVLDDGEARIPRAGMGDADAGHAMLPS